MLTAEVITIIATITTIVGSSSAAGESETLTDPPLSSGSKLEAKLNEFFVGLDKIDKAGIVSPSPKQIFWFNM